MRKVIVSNLMSLDGFLEGPGHDLSWFAVDDEFFDYAKGLLDTADTILFGRVTYEMMAAYWTSPAAAQENDAFITGKMNSLEKRVFSHTLTQAGWGSYDNARLVKGDAAAEVRKLKDMVIFGSGGLVSTLASHGLIDEYRVVVNPVILGSGTPMFRGIGDRIKLKLTANRAFKTGAIMLTYHPESVG
jgi:dihydrofolate reductase